MQKSIIKKKKLCNHKYVTNYNFSCNNQIFINKSLTKTNKSLAFCGRKLKRSWLIHSCIAKEGVVHIRNSEHAKAIKVHHINSLYEQFPEFVFFDDDDCDLFVDASPNVLDQSSYWSNLYSCVLGTFISWFVNLISIISGLNAAQIYIFASS